MTFLDQIHKTRIMIGWMEVDIRRNEKQVLHRGLGSCSGLKGTNRFRAREHGSLNWVGVGPRGFGDKGFGAS